MPLSEERKTFANGYVFRVPVRDFGLFASVLVALATGMMAFFAGTFLGILTVAFAHAAGHPWDFAWSYSRIGFPVGVVVMASALVYMGMLYARRISRKA